MAGERRVLEVSDPIRLRALAHPTRMRLLRLVRERGPVTGAELAESVGESTASVSYHLSVLARHGFIEPDPQPGATRRHKPWRATFESMRIVGEHTGLPPVETPEGVVLGSLLSEYRAEQDAFFQGAPGLAPEWQDSGTFQLTRLTLTADELDRLSGELEALLDRYRTGRPSSPHQHAFSVSFIAVPTAGPADPGSAS